MKSPRSYIVGILALLVGAGAIVIWRQSRELAALRAGTVGAEERADFQKRLWAAEKRAQELKAKLDAGGARPAAAGGAVATDSGGRGGPRGPVGMDNILVMMEDPAIQRLMAVQAKGALDGRYAALFKNLNLAPDQLDRFKNLLVEKQTAMQDVMVAARNQGIDPRTDPEGFSKMVQSTQADVDASIKTALGDTGFAQYQQYQQTLPQRNIVTQLQQSLSYTTAPLSDAQAEQVVQILSQTMPKPAAAPDGAVGASNVTVRMEAPGGAGNGGQVLAAIGGAFGFGSSAPITNDAITQAQGVLSSTQLAALQQLQAQQQAAKQLQDAIRAVNPVGPPARRG